MSHHLHHRMATLLVKRNALLAAKSKVNIDQVAALAAAEQKRQQIMSQVNSIDAQLTSLATQ